MRVVRAQSAGSARRKATHGARLASFDHDVVIPPDDFEALRSAMGRLQLSLAGIKCQILTTSLAVRRRDVAHFALGYF
jgi:hypothetical protein